MGPLDQAWEALKRVAAGERDHSTISRLKARYGSKQSPDFANLGTWM